MIPVVFLKASSRFIVFLHKLTEYMQANDLKGIGMIPNNTILSDSFFNNNTGYRRGIENLVATGQLTDGNRIAIVEYRVMHHLMNVNVGQVEDTTIRLESNYSNTLMLSTPDGEIPIQCHMVEKITMVDELTNKPVLVFEVDHIADRDTSSDLDHLKKQWFFNSNTDDTSVN